MFKFRFGRSKLREIFEHYRKAHRMDHNTVTANESPAEVAERKKVERSLTGTKQLLGSFAQDKSRARQGTRRTDITRLNPKAPHGNMVKERMRVIPMAEVNRTHSVVFYSGEQSLHYGYGVHDSSLDEIVVMSLDEIQLQYGATVIQEMLESAKAFR